MAYLVKLFTFVKHSFNCLNHLYINKHKRNDFSYGNSSIINWGSSIKPVQDSFNCIASATLPAGVHTIQFTAVAYGPTNFKVGSGTITSISVNPAPDEISSDLPLIYFD